ncbi:MAG: hypothetical protein C4520_11540 [Candidatus Abyssobacteria bacterium SURF_5]|uniref:Uncharacterized protein n=1 Tax=Abyssobacteria bacterium (strain SURF_5) TaxID=2093360 RepID=A0A3A4NX98_ABYX5|nr:MAG: hypothetical protein C4520_11540 [Candidatus Abyssubacteria bacterium SURF_5]
MEQEPQKPDASKYADARKEKKLQAQEEQFWKRITTAGTFALVGAIAAAAEVLIKTLLKRH